MHEDSKAESEELSGIGHNGDGSGRLRLGSQLSDDRTHPNRACLRDFRVTVTNWEANLDPNRHDLVLEQCKCRG